MQKATPEIIVIHFEEVCLKSKLLLTVPESEVKARLQRKSIWSQFREPERLRNLFYRLERAGMGLRLSVNYHSQESPLSSVCGLDVVQRYLDVLLGKNRKLFTDNAHILCDSQTLTTHVVEFIKDYNAKNAERPIPIEPDQNHEQAFAAERCQRVMILHLNRQRAETKLEITSSTRWKYTNLERIKIGNKEFLRVFGLENFFDISSTAQYKVMLGYDSQKTRLNLSWIEEADDRYQYTRLCLSLLDKAQNALENFQQQRSQLNPSGFFAKTAHERYLFCTEHYLRLLKKPDRPLVEKIVIFYTLMFSENLEDLQQHIAAACTVDQLQLTQFLMNMITLHLKIQNGSSRVDVIEPIAKALKNDFVSPLINALEKSREPDDALNAKLHRYFEKKV